MLVKMKNMTLVAALLAPVAAFAQDQEAPALDLSPGQPVAPEVVSEAFGDWTVNCQTVNEAERCQMYQLLRDNDDNPVMEVNLFRVEGQPNVFAGGTVVAPLETLLPPQITIAIDEGLGKRYPFAFCVPTGCVSRIGLTEEDVNSYKQGGKATVSIVPAVAPDQRVSLDMSLSGFTKAFDRLSQ